MNSTTYPVEDWDNYALAHQSVMPSQMLALNQDVAVKTRGDVVDLGCGTAKIAPFVLNIEAVKSYTGVDYSKEMAERARWMLRHFPTKPGKICVAKIEAFETQRRFDSAVSINSYYAWDDPLSVFSHIHALLKPGGTFVIATPNPRIDMAGLLEEAGRELIAHPYYPAFRKMNLAFCANNGARFIELDQLVTELQDTGFELTEATQDHYRGGINLVTATKPI